MRVISGSAGGRKLISPETNNVRPTLDRVKEAVFNMISFDLLDADILDLFAGSGALGIEALSRGAKKAVFVDQESSSLSIVRQNLALTRLEDRAECIHKDFSSYLDSTSRSFDIIFLDPPYAAGFLEEALLKIRDRKLLNEGGTIVCELDSKDEYHILDGFQLYRDKKYGKARILLMKEL